MARRLTTLQMQKLATVLQLAGVILMGLDFLVGAERLVRLDQYLKRRLEGMRMVKEQVRPKFSALLRSTDFWLKFVVPPFFITGAAWIGAKIFDNEGSIGDIGCLLLFSSFSVGVYWLIDVMLLGGIMILGLFVDLLRLAIRVAAVVLSRPPQPVIVAIGFFLTLAGTLMALLE